MYKVLLVEDNKVNQVVAMTMLKKAGLQVELASDGHQAVEMAENGCFQLILMDYHMPMLNGADAARQIRLSDASVPIIAITAATEKDMEGLCKEAGMNDFISKPIQMDLLNEKVAYWLSNRMKDAG